MASGFVIESVGRAADERAIAVLARAFRDNPLDLAVIGGSQAQRLRRVTWGMRSSVEAARRAPTSVLLGAHPPGQIGTPVGILLAMPSAALPLPAPPLLRQLRLTLGQGFRTVGRWGQVHLALGARDLSEPHWYLSLLGVDPPRHGLGVGRLLLRAWLDRVDRDDLPSHLETDRERNIGFYARAGFEVRAEIEVLGMPVWCMRRPSRSECGERLPDRFGHFVLDGNPRKWEKGQADA